MRRGVVLAAVAAVLAVLGVVVAPGAVQARAGEVTSTSPPRVGGEPEYGATLRAGPGRWEPRPVSLAYRWLRDGRGIRGARDRTYVPGAADLGHRLSVVVVATDAEGHRGRATSAPTPRVRRAPMVNRRAPAVRGTQRFFHTVTADPGRWSTTPTRVRYQWLRSGQPVRGATHRRYRFAPEDVGSVVRVQVTVTAPGHERARSLSPRTPPVRHRVDVRRTATYSVATRGHVTAPVGLFTKLAQQTYDDPRGWRAKGVRFRRVPRGGSFTLVLAEASTVPSFSSACSAQWSCRVGRYVVINQTRWQHASPAWNRAGRSLRDYRHMVVNHETGHWLGKGHASCPGRGRLAPVMMQQSKGTQGCRLNPWPTRHELR